MNLKTKISSLPINKELKNKLLGYLSEPGKAERIEKAINQYLHGEKLREEALFKVKTLESRFIKEIRDEAEQIEKENNQIDISTI